MQGRCRDVSWGNILKPDNNFNIIEMIVSNYQVDVIICEIIKDVSLINKRSRVSASHDVWWDACCKFCIVLKSSNVSWHLQVKVKGTKVRNSYGWLLSTSVWICYSFKILPSNQFHGSFSPQSIPIVYFVPLLFIQMKSTQNIIAFRVTIRRPYLEFQTLQFKRKAGIIMIEILMLLVI